MATPAELAARIAQIEAALGDPAVRVDLGDGRGRTLRNVTDLQAALAALRAEELTALNLDARAPRVVRFAYSKGIC